MIDFAVAPYEMQPRCGASHLINNRKEKHVADHVELSEGQLKVIKQALKVPAKNLLSDAEKKFVTATKERFENFGERIHVSEKQLAWLRKIAERTKKTTPTAKKTTAPADDAGENGAYGDYGGE